MVEIRTYTRIELCESYNITSATFNTWLKPFISELTAIGYTKKQRIFTPKQVKLIFERLDFPEKTDNISS